MLQDAIKISARCDCSFRDQRLMCGIAALIEPGLEFQPSLLAAMGEDLRHRGPDSDGMLIEPGIGMVFRRLAILDPTARADQPMSDEQSRATLIYNGEIYNFRELRSDLEAKGVTFNTTGDTEVILKGYLHWGENVLDRLEGMYALVLLDRRNNEVMAARDPFGIKPLYMLRSGNLTGFASEMRPLARVKQPEPDPTALSELLIFGWAAGALSNLEGIERVPGGTLLKISLADGSISRKRFCDPLDTIDTDNTLDEIEARKLAADALVSSVEAHMVSDVGYSVQLSGGVDSSLITAIAAQKSDARIDTFGIRLEDKRFDESQWRDQVVERYRVNHHERDLTARDFADALPRAVKHMEGPSPHLGCILLMLLCDSIAGTTKVVLTGEGGDEFFGGYSHYADWKRLRAQERAGKMLPVSLLPEIPPFIALRRFAGQDRAAYATVRHDPRLMHQLFPALAPAPGAREHASARFDDFRDRLCAVDQTAYLESLLVRQDKMAMAASVEARVPFVHLPLARVLNGLPNHLRIPGGITKPVLKQISEKHLPRDLLYRRKVGLQLPANEWLADGAGLGRYLDDVIAPDSRLAAYTERTRLVDAVERFRKGDTTHAHGLVRLANIETWLRTLKSPTGATLRQTP